MLEAVNFLSMWDFIAVDAPSLVPIFTVAVPVSIFYCIRSFGDLGSLLCLFNSQLQHL